VITPGNITPRANFGIDRLGGGSPQIREILPLISAISQSRLGCNIGGMFANLFAYADDMVLLAPSWHAMQALIKLLDVWCAELDRLLNVTPKRRSA